MTIDPQDFPFPLTPAFIDILENELAKSELPAGIGIVLNFRDPSYCAKTGGYHPVEISVSSRGRIEYITDFAYVGSGPFTELVKEIDFDIDLGLFQHFGREFPLHEGRELFELWMANFVSYYRAEVYTVDASES